jgi:hypothetical protein
VLLLLKKKKMLKAKSKHVKLHEIDWKAKEYQMKWTFYVLELACPALMFDNSVQLSSRLGFLCTHSNTIFVGRMLECVPHHPTQAADVGK